ncbi:hypothetical protein HAX54_007859 [Datura stramonium]|uniref:Uncharacterized protein n=1 Tax=Datura stramonium TaxID=4076 RepID=A0ABS8TDL5_DATST|nr:hypothetical protein [Datura stramonium]
MGQQHFAIQPPPSPDPDWGRQGNSSTFPLCFITSWHAWHIENYGLFGIGGGWGCLGLPLIFPCGCGGCLYLFSLPG